MIHTRHFIAVVLALFSAFVMVTPGYSQQPIVTDSRIKTLVFNENDVYSVVTHYGYQTNIEFAKNEEVLTISLGDRIAWQVIPHDRRLFIRAMENGVRTNMTVITNKRAYQFDLQSTDGKQTSVTPEIAYVIRFYYPDEQPAYRPVESAEFSGAMQQAAQPTSGGMNFNYTFTGPDTLAPLKIFDNGKMTFFKLSAQSIEPSFFAVSPQGEEKPLVASRTSSGYYVITGVAQKFLVRYGKDIVCIYNEQR